MAGSDISAILFPLHPSRPLHHHHDRCSVFRVLHVRGRRTVGDALFGTEICQDMSEQTSRLSDHISLRPPLVNRSVLRLLLRSSQLLIRCFSLTWLRKLLLPYRSAVPRGGGFGTFIHYIWLVLILHSSSALSHYLFSWSSLSTPSKQTVSFTSHFLSKQISFEEHLSDTDLIIQTTLSLPTRQFLRGLVTKWSDSMAGPDVSVLLLPLHF